jgi:hypothetical protein
MDRQSGSTSTWGGDVDDSRVQAEFKRMQYHRDLEKAREIIAQYNEGYAKYRERIEDLKYKIGRLDERLED